MKILLCVILIFAIVFSCGILQLTFIRKCTDTLNKHITALNNAIHFENENDFFHTLRLFKQDWEKMHSKLCAIINHDYIFEIDNTISELENLHNSDFLQYSLSLSNLKNSVESIYEESCFSLENIF